MSEYSGGKHVVVIGAGIVGICCALYLQREGCRVTLIDRDPPGDGCSLGNAGLFAVEHVCPNAVPGIALQVPGMLLHPLGPLAIRPSYLPRLVPWLLKFLQQGRRERVEAISIALNQLNQHALSAFAPLLKSAGAEDMIQQRGWLEIYQSEKAFAKSALKLALQQRRGVRVELLNAAQVREMEPALKGPLARGLFFPDAAHSVNPHRFSKVLVADFIRQGGTIVQEEVLDFSWRDGRVTGVRTAGKMGEAGAVPEAAAVVLAAGAFSQPLAARLGTAVPLETERGYHMMLPQPGVNLRQPLMSGDHKFAITSMEHGLRIAGTAEYAGLSAPPNYARAQRLLTAARTLLPDLQDSGAEPWMGHRPAMPDSLPVISAARGAANVILAFGHGHLGLTHAAITGKLAAQLISGQSTTIDTTPFAADRFY